MGNNIFDSDIRWPRHHKESITVSFGAGRKKRFHNIPSIVNGKKLSTGEAVSHARKTGQFGRAFKTKDTAVATAKAVSQRGPTAKPNNKSRKATAKTKKHI